MAIGWCDDLDDAKLYFDEERFDSQFWDALGDDDSKTDIIVQSYNRLYYGDDFELPLYADATADQLVILRKANCEMAYYLALHLGDEDRRKGLHAQGVVEAGIVKEKYDKDMLMTTPVPPFVYDMLVAAGFKKVKLFKIAEIERDENKELRK